MIDDEQRTAPFWAMVQVVISRPVVRAVRLIPVNALVSSEDLAEAVEQSSLLDATPPLRLADLVGKEARRRIDAKQVIQPTWIREPRLIRKGQAVRVLVESGQARVGLDGRALNSGSFGETLLVKNDENGRMFRAEVTGPGTVVVRMEAKAR
ncbi:MAG TPA: flagellar basal body P-ring formation chaperone FlgA [Paludibaculum sp.]